jgi:hypothetical protein
MNNFLAALFLLFGLLSITHYPGKKIIIWFIDYLENKKLMFSLSLSIFILGAISIYLSINISDWNYRAGPLILFILGILLILRALTILIFPLQLKKALQYILQNIPVFTTTLSGVFLILLSVFTVSRDYIGPFKDLSDCSNSQVLTVYCITSNPEDLALTPDNQSLIVSEFGGIRPYEESQEGSFSIFDLTTSSIKEMPIIMGLNVWGEPQCQRNSETFGPHGIDLNKRDDGSYQLAVVNHYPTETIEFFELRKDDQWSLIWKGCVNVPEKYYFNDIALESDGSFYVTHMYPREITITAWLNAALFKYSTGLVLFWSHNKFEELEFTKAGQPNGIVKSGNTLYVANNLSDSITGYDLVEQQEIAHFHINSPDNLILQDDSIWVTSLEHEAVDVLSCPSEQCSLPFNVYSLSSQDLKLQKVYSFNEDVMGLPTVALPVDDKIWMGSFRLDRLVNFDK